MRGAAWAWAGESLQEPGPEQPWKKTLELACCYQHPLTPRVGLLSPATALPQSQSPGLRGHHYLILEGQ